MAGLLGSLGGITQRFTGELPIPGLDSPGAAAGAEGLKASGLSKLTNFIKEGIPVGRYTLLFLCGIIPYVPFSTLGYSGMNLLVGGSMLWAGMKGMVQGLFALIHRYLNVYYPSLWWVRYMTMYSPWYIFDILQTLSPEFEREGYKKPFVGGEPIAAEGGMGKLTAINIPLILGILSVGTYMLVQKLPPEIVSTAKPVLDMVTLIIGGGSVMAAGGMGAFTVIPQLMSGLRSSSAQISTTMASAGTAATAPVPAPAVVAAPATTPTQLGGAPGPGSSIPSLREIANDMLPLDPAGGPAPYTSNILAGGGRRSRRNGPTEEPDSVLSAIFFSAIALIVGGGLGLALIRNKTDSS